MRVVILVVTWLVAASAQADMYISIDANGGYVLSNVHRPGRHYERVISESLAQAGPVDAQMITGRPYAELAAAAARDYDVPLALLHALIKAESDYNPKARSAAGAVGLMQLMPDTARRWAWRTFWTPKTTCRAGRATSSAC